MPFFKTPIGEKFTVTGRDFIKVPGGAIFLGNRQEILIPYKDKEQLLTDENKRISEIAIDSGFFSSRTRNALLHADVYNAEILLEAFKKDKLKYMRGLGEGAIAEIFSFFTAHNIKH